MQISDKGLALLKASEGFRNRVYKDVAGFDTVAFGHRLTATEIANNTFSDGVDEVMGEQLLEKDVLVAENSVLRFVKVPLTQGQFDALVDWVFNLGSSRLRNSTMLQLLNAGHYDSAANELLKWDKANVDGKMVPVAGLTKRRQAEYALWYS